MLQFLEWVSGNPCYIYLYACMLSKIECTSQEAGSESHRFSEYHTPDGDIPVMLAGCL